MFSRVDGAHRRERPGRAKAGLAALALLLVACPKGEKPAASANGDPGPATAFAAPATPEAAAAEGMRLLRGGAYEAAEPHLLRAFAAHPGDVRLQGALGQVYAHTNRFKQAETSFRQVIAIKPDDPGARLALAKLLGDTGRDAEGLEVL